MELSSYCKYFSSSSEVLNGVFKDRKIRFTQPWGLNDPLEGTPAIRFKRADADISYKLNGITYPSEQLFYRIQLIEATVNSFGMLSLTNIPDSFEMWALYADGHRGFVVEFAESFNERPCMHGAGDIYPVEKVEYVDDYVIDPDNLYDGETLNYEALIKSVFLRKTKRWGHEREFRIVRPLTDCAQYKSTAGYKTSYRDNGVYLFDLDPECIASIIFGIHMSSKDKRYVYDRVSGTGINLFQACLLPSLKDDTGHQGQLILIPLNQFGDPKVVLDSSPQAFSALDGNPQEKKHFQMIDTLTELPYYKRFPNIVEQFRKAKETTEVIAQPSATLDGLYRC